MKKHADPANTAPADHIAVAFDQEMFAHGSREILLAKIATDAAKKMAVRRKKPSARQRGDELPSKGLSNAIDDASQNDGTESGEPASVANTAQENLGAAHAETGNAPLPAPLAASVHLAQNTTGDTLTDAGGLDVTTPETTGVPPVVAMDTEPSRIGLLEILLGGLGVVALGLAVTQEAGSAGAESAATVIDSPPPTATLKIFAGLSHDSATVWSSENGTVYLVNKSVAVSTLADITGAADTLWNKVEVTANTDTALSLVGLLPQGAYRLYFVDAAGNLSPAAVDTGTVDTTSLALASDTGSSNSDSITNIGTVNVNGLKSGATWEYLVDGGNWITGSGSSFTANPGHHSYVVRQTDKAGHTISISSIITCELDTTAPAIPSLSLASDTGSSNSDGITRYATIIVSGLEVDTSWEYQLDNGNWIPGDSWIPDGNRLTASAGSHTYAIRQTDLAGNTSLSPSVIYTLDNTAPTCTITDDISGTATATDVPTFSFTFSEAVTHFTAGDITLSAGTQSVFSKIDSSHYTLTVTPPSGLGTMSVDVATGSFDDLAGNANTADTTADAQRYSTLPSTLDLGTVSGINLHLIMPVTMANGKVYYFLDNFLDGAASGMSGTSDPLTHNQLDPLLNSGADTIDTQRSGAVKGVDDARTLIAGVAGEYTLVLPTLAELTALYNDPSLPGHPPPGWGYGYWSATQTSVDTHSVFNLAYGTASSFDDIAGAYVALQVL